MDFHTWPQEQLDKFLAIVLEYPAIEWFDETQLALFATYLNTQKWGKIKQHAREIGISSYDFENAVRLVPTVDAIPPKQSLQELLERPRTPMKWVVERLLPRSGLSLLTGDPKAGKSTLCRWLMYCVVNGKPFSGRKCVQGHVVYYVLEEIIDEIVENFRLLGGNTNITIRSGGFPDGAFLPTLQQDIEELSPTLAIVDPVFDVLGVRDLNSYAEVNSKLKALVSVVRKSNLHLLALHHSNKSQAKDSSGILGSQAIRGSTDANLFLRVTEMGRRQLICEQRGYASGKPLPKMYADIDSEHKMNFKPCLI